MKVLVQSLWTTGIDWDIPRPPWMEQRWRGWMEQLEMLPKIKIPTAWISYPVNGETTCWSDSRVALAWIKEAPARWKPFIANRVQEIQESASCWRYCPTKEKSAEIPSRGCLLETLTNSALWLHGPPWLMQNAMAGTGETAADHQHLVAGQRAISVLTGQTDKCSLEQVINPTRYNRYEPLIRVTAEVQVKEFGIKLNSTERLKKFKPFLDQDGLLRMGGRLRRSTLPPESKHPIILPHNHPVTELLIKDHYCRQMHAGVNQTLVQDKTVQDKPVCHRVEVQPYRLRMSDVLADRVTESPLSSYTSMDFAGPLFARPECLFRSPDLEKPQRKLSSDIASGVNHLMRRWRYQQRLTIQLWKRWKQEYITTLAPPGKWRKTGKEPKVRDIVLVHEPATT
ncbi:hypothetical protein T4D_684 [Trichinella pseudospiralis]|uniref:DUF5641 domain-containing protein n=1 Tax=Trichinella pseudospiralis TaxID=6337 RepID=A0A0V1FF70_TRIPS|nr:hypothetical protein T4D_684 [Trichinella pseudospiralis]